MIANAVAKGPETITGVRKAAMLLILAGLVAWFLAALLCAAFMFQGVMPPGIMNITILVLLVEYPLAVVLGAKLYVDEPTPTK